MHETKKNLMDAGIRLIREHGYENVTVEDICTACGTTRGAFYHHFKSKDDMLENYYRILSESNEELILKLIETGAPDEQLWRLYEFFIDNTISLGPDLLGRLFMISIGNGGRVFSSLANEGVLAFKLASSIIARGQEVGCIVNYASPRELLDLFIRALLGIALDWASRHGDFDEKAELRKLFELVFYNRPAR